MQEGEGEGLRACWCGAGWLGWPKRERERGERAWVGLGAAQAVGRGGLGVGQKGRGGGV